MIIHYFSGQSFAGPLGTILFWPLALVITLGSEFRLCLFALGGSTAASLFPRNSSESFGFFWPRINDTLMILSMIYRVS